MLDVRLFFSSSCGEVGQANQFSDKNSARCGQEREDMQQARRVWMEALPRVSVSNVAVMLDGNALKKGPSLGGANLPWFSLLCESVGVAFIV